MMSQAQECKQQILHTDKNQGLSMNSQRIFCILERGVRAKKGDEMDQSQKKTKHIMASQWKGGQFQRFGCKHQLVQSQLGEQTIIVRLWD